MPRPSPQVVTTKEFRADPATMLEWVVSRQQAISIISEPLPDRPQRLEDDSDGRCAVLVPAKDFDELVEAYWEANRLREELAEVSATQNQAVTS